jgi:hypothetical protein
MQGERWGEVVGTDEVVENRGERGGSSLPEEGSGGGTDKMNRRCLLL